MYNFYAFQKLQNVKVDLRWRRELPHSVPSVKEGKDSQHEPLPNEEQLSQGFRKQYDSNVSCAEQM